MSNQDKELAVRHEDDAAEVAYWRFDARVKGYSKWKGRPQSERDAFNAEYRQAESRYTARIAELEARLSVSDKLEEAACRYLAYKEAFTDLSFIAAVNPTALPNLDMAETQYAKPAETLLQALCDYEAMKVGEFCSYPDCNCPFDAPADPNWCARGYPHAPKGGA